MLLATSKDYKDFGSREGIPSHLLHVFEPLQNGTGQQNPKERWSVCGGAGITQEGERTPELPTVLQTQKPQRQIYSTESQLEARFMGNYEVPLPAEGRESAGIRGKVMKVLIANVTIL